MRKRLQKLPSYLIANKVKIRKQLKNKSKNGKMPIK